ncbi:hypothetical protein BUALT_Bualt12G0087800 [Buddleja alternifolia]|uniref:G-patch domain-containing protein n=1 Tax=Buddleja alternifolia TaxID=168488 RepID=A0AAV6WNQ6_9LAMI|nr:hypothetical protein BUALT_Bualt12G0087800 [Buddleja alternifolia]
MGGNNRKKLNKSKSRRPRPPASSSGNRGLFVEGGLLSDWSAFNSPPSRGRKGANMNPSSGNVKGSGYDPGSGSGSGRRSETKKSTGNAIAYRYPQLAELYFNHEGKEFLYSSSEENRENNLDASNPVVLIDSEKTPIIAYLDEGSVKESQNVEYMYDYTTSFTLGESSHRGLGFHDEVETTTDGIGSSSKMEEEKESGSSSFEEGDMSADVVSFHDANAETGEDEDMLAEMSPEEEDPGYVLIGGTKIYTRDISDEDEEQELSDEESLDSSDSEDSSSESDGSSYSGSDVDDEVAADYFEGIGGIGNVVNVDQLVGQMSDDSSDSEDNIDETVQKLSGIALQEASKEYGRKQPVSGRKFRKEDKRSIPVNYGWSSALDDLMLVKDPRTFSGKKKHVSRIPQSWPSEASKSKRHRRMPGEKKKHRKELIAAKRQDRMIRRGVDLQKINLKLQQMVLDGVDMFSFQPMHPRDCTQLRRLASIYRWRSGCQGSGKKRFVTVVRTQHTCMPSSSDKIRLEKLIGTGDEDADFSVITGKPIKVDTNATKKAAGIGDSTPIRSRSSRNKSSIASKEAKNSRTGKIGSYAAQPPLSFVSSGNMTSETIELKPIESNETKDTCQERKIMSSSVEYGSFEMHTTGFGSKMMAKMGYVEGGGLGKDGQGMAQPIEVYQRPKSLGLGAEVPETSNGTPKNTGYQPKSVGRGAKSSGSNGRSVKNESSKIGSFEKHTKGFGSKMMAKMGFVEGMGLGKDSQGIINPLVAVRRPKARGLGAMT